MSTKDEIQKAVGARLKAARLAANYTTATDAASALGVSRDSYIQYENGTMRLPVKKAEHFAKRFKTSPEHLLFGRVDSALVRIIGTVGAATDGTVVMETAHERWDFAPVAPGGTAAASALEVRGGSMPGLAEDGALLYFEEQVTKPGKDMMGRIVIVETIDGRVLVKRLLRGSSKGLFDLESILGPTLEDVQLKWAAHITAIIPPIQAQKIIRRWDAAA